MGVELRTPANLCSREPSVRWIEHWCPEIDLSGTPTLPKALAQSAQGASEWAQPNQEKTMGRPRCHAKFFFTASANFWKMFMKLISYKPTTIQITGICIS